MAEFPRDLAASFAVEMWMDHKQQRKKLPEPLQQTLLDAGVGVRLKNGTVTLNERGFEIRDRLAKFGFNVTEHGGDDAKG